MHRSFRPASVVTLGTAALAGVTLAAPRLKAEPAPAPFFAVRSAHSGNWSDPATWEGRHLPQAGERVQVRAGHHVVYDVNSDQPIRMVHVAGELSFSREKSTRLDVGLLRVEPGETSTEDGFACDQHHELPAADPRAARPVLEIGTAERPIPAGITATIRLAYFPGMDRETLPAIINCGGRWDVHGAPLSRTWLKLAAPAHPGDRQVTLEEPVSGWRPGDHLIVTGGKEADYNAYHRPANGGPAGNTEERTVAEVSGATLTLDRPLQKEHYGGGEMRSEVADLSRNVVIESADPAGVRGHTMYHLNSTGGISYAEFRHLGKEGVLGKYAIHFHLVRDTMRGSGVLGASIWDSRNRWITIHGTDYLRIRDCVGYQSIGHGFFLEDGTEQYNLLDRNLAVQAFDGKRLPKQVLPFDANDGAGFWWANGRNSFVRNVACENEHYGYHFELAQTRNFDPRLPIRTPNGDVQQTDIRTLPFLRFEENESHGEGLYSFNFGDDRNPSVHGDKQHPFICRNLRAWETHYCLRPNLQYFLMDGFRAINGVYGVYHPDYDAHVYRNISLNNVDSEPINRGHDDDSIQYGTFTYENLTLENCRVGRDPLIQLTCTSPTPGQTGHFRNLVLKNSSSHDGKVVDLGGGPRNPKLENGVAYYFHDYPAPGRTVKVVSVHFPDLMKDGRYQNMDGFTGKDVRAAEVSEVPFPTLLSPVDDLPPATLITSVEHEKGKVRLHGISHDNGEVARVAVNGKDARIVFQQSGVADWEIVLDVPADGKISAAATDREGNREKMGQVIRLGK